MSKLLRFALLASLSFPALAQPDGGDEEKGGEGPPRWSWGVGAIFNDSPYAGEGTRVMPVPLIRYNGERLSVGIGGITWRFVGTDSFELSAVAKGRFAAFEVKDLGREELARNGIDYRLLEDRDNGLDLGVTMKWTGRLGEVETELLTDASDTSGGHEVNVQYGYPIELGHGMLTPNIALKWQSKDLANYEYGTLAEEVARGVVDYKPGALTLPSVGLNYFRPLGEHWSLIAFGQYTLLPDEVQDSPLIEPGTDGTASMFVGFSRGF
jgi:MipA family protein